MFSKISNKVKGFYLLWVVVHLTLALNNMKYFFSSQFAFPKMFPFYEGYKSGNYNWTRLNAYDITEFLFYTIVPILLYKVYLLIINSDDFKRGYIDGMTDE